MAFTISPLLDSSITHLTVTAEFIFKGLGLHYRMVTHKAVALSVCVAIHLVEIIFSISLLNLCNTKFGNVSHVVYFTVFT